MTRGSAAASFADTHETGRGTELGFEEHTAFGAMAEGATVDEASAGAVDTGEDGDTRPSSPRRPPNWVGNILTYSAELSLTAAVLSIIIMAVAQLLQHVGDMGAEALNMTAGMMFAAAVGCGAFWAAVKMMLIFFMMGMPPAAAYSVA